MGVSTFHRIGQHVFDAELWIFFHFQTCRWAAANVDWVVKQRWPKPNKAGVFLRICSRYTCTLYTYAAYVYNIHIIYLLTIVWHVFVGKGSTIWFLQVCYQIPKSEGPRGTRTKNSGSTQMPPFLWSPLGHLTWQQPQAVSSTNNNFVERTCVNLFF